MVFSCKAGKHGVGGRAGPYSARLAYMGGIPLGTSSAAMPVLYVTPFYMPQVLAYYLFSMC
jgi:hypothetical protein